MISLKPYVQHILRNLEMTPSLKGSMIMAMALCMHFYGFEMARAASIALLAADDIGLGSGALSFTVAVGSPISATVLYLYARSIKKNGPRLTLLASNVGCLLLLFLMAMACGSLRGQWGQAVVLLFYCFREIYVSLLSTQHWSFIASVLDSKTSSYLVSFSGVVSVASAVGSMSVEGLVSLGGVRALLIMAFLSCGMSFGLAEMATFTAPPNLTTHSRLDGQKRHRERSSSSSSSSSAAAAHHKGPKDTKSTHTTTGGTVSSSNHSSSHSLEKAVGQSSVSSSSATTTTTAASATATTKKSDRKSLGFMRESFDLLMKHDTLQLLFIEALVHQACGNMLNMMFHDGLRTGVPLDSERAVLVGRFFASVNVAACVLQICIMPHVLSQSTVPQVLSAVPLIVLMIVVGGFFYPSLLSVMIAFGALKVLEYSVMTSATEMIYMPMGPDHRYLGKEMVRFFGHRMGKSGATLLLSAASAHFSPSMSTQSMWSFGITAAWSGIMVVLSRHLATRNETLLAAAAAAGDAPTATGEVTAPEKKEEVVSAAAGVPVHVRVAGVKGGGVDATILPPAPPKYQIGDQHDPQHVQMGVKHSHDSCDSMGGAADSTPQSPATLWTSISQSGGSLLPADEELVAAAPAPSSSSSSSSSSSLSLLRTDSHAHGQGQPISTSTAGDYDELVVLDEDSQDAIDHHGDRQGGVAGAAGLRVASRSVGGAISRTDGDDGDDRTALRHHLPDGGVDAPGAPDGLRQRNRRQGLGPAPGLLAPPPPPPSSIPSSPGTRACRSFEDIYDMTTVREGTQPPPSVFRDRGGGKGSSTGPGGMGLPQVSSEGELSPYPSVRGSPNSSSRRKALAASLPFKFADTWLGRLWGGAESHPLMLRVGSTCVSMHNLAVAGWDGIREGGMSSSKLSSRQSLNRINSGNTMTSFESMTALKACLEDTSEEGILMGGEGVIESPPPPPPP